MMCKFRTSDAEMQCVLDMIEIESENCQCETVTIKGLCLSGGKIYQIKEHRRQGGHPYEGKEDVTDDVLDALLLALQKREVKIGGTAHEYAVIELKRKKEEKEKED